MFFEHAPERRVNRDRFNTHHQFPYRIEINRSSRTKGGLHQGKEKMF